MWVERANIIFLRHYVRYLSGIWIHIKPLCNKSTRLWVGLAPQVQTLPLPKGNTLPPPPFPDWEHSLASLSRGEFSPWGAQEQRPSVKSGEAGSPAQVKAFSKMKRRRRQGSVEETPFQNSIQNSNSQSVVCGTLDVPETLSWDPWGESYFHSITQILFDFSLCWHLLWCITAVMETMVANLTSNYFHQNFLVGNKKTNNQVCFKTSRMTH